MRIPTKLLFLAAFFALALPLLFIAGNAQATAPWVYDDGAGLKDNGQWQVIDPGSCVSNPAQVTRAACTAEDFTGTYGTAALCAPSAYCTDGVSLTATACNLASYRWITVRLWNGSQCRGNWPSKRVYGPAAIGACSLPPYASETTCTTNAGTWTATTNGDSNFNESERVQCLHCHNDAYGTHALNTFGNGSTQETYFRTGHRNVTRHVTRNSLDTAYIPLGGPNYTFSNDGLGTGAYTNVNWATGLAGTQQTYYIYNSWFSAIKVNQIEDDPTPDAATASTVTNFSGARTCFFCHTSAYKLPEARYPLALETMDASVTSADALGKFEIGITCVTCHKGAGNLWTDYNLEHHNATSTNDFGNFPQFEEGTALCMTCHRLEDTSGPITTAAVQDDALIIEGLEDHHGNIGAQFLQSPHAKFTGTYGSIQDPTKYASGFSLNGFGCSDPQYHAVTTCTTNSGIWATTGVQHNMGCQECHNPHVSGVDPDTRDITTSQTQLTQYCVECHSDPDNGFGAPQINIASMDHPTGAHTPLNAGSIGNEKVVNMACIRCHMSNRINHLFKINTDRTYSTFDATLCSDVQYETRETCTGHGKTWSDMGTEFGLLQAAPSGFGELDVNWACLWCHNGTDGPIGDKSWASDNAAGIHMNRPTASFSASPDSTTSFQVNFNAAGSTCPAGYTCTYDWDFGDLGTGTGIGTSHIYADATPVIVTLTVTASSLVSDTATKTVTPVAVNQPPTCSTEAIAAVNKGTASTFTDASADPDGSGTAAVYVDWRDGSGLVTGALGATFSHTYANAGTYQVRKTVRDSLGANCVVIMPAVVNNPAVGGTTGSITITTADSAPFFTFSYTVKQGGMTKKTGSGTTGTPVVVTGLPSTGTFNVYLYYATGHTCTFTNGRSVAKVAQQLLQPAISSS